MYELRDGIHSLPRPFASNDDLGLILNELLYRVAIEVDVGSYIAYDILLGNEQDTNTYRKVMSALVLPYAYICERNAFEGVCEVLCLEANTISPPNEAGSHTPESLIRHTTLSTQDSWKEWLQTLKEIAETFIAMGKSGAAVGYDQNASLRARWSDWGFVGGVPQVMLTFGNFKDATLQSRLDEMGIWSWRHSPIVRDYLNLQPQAVHTA
jgi:hypothetical protein